MMSLEKFIPKEIFVRLTGEGFVSTVRYGGLYAKTATWHTRSSEDAGKLAFTQPDLDKSRHEPEEDY